MDVVIKCYMLELYKDDVKDLLHGHIMKTAASGKKIRIAKDVNGVVRVSNASTIEVANIEQFEALLQFGSRRRATSASKHNISSSRSHLVVSVVIECTNKIKGSCKQGTTTHGRLTLVDLAGSEKMMMSGAQVIS
jgi:hypothetical protein